MKSVVNNIITQRISKNCYLDICPTRSKKNVYYPQNANEFLHNYCNSTKLSLLPPTKNSDQFATYLFRI